MRGGGVEATLGRNPKTNMFLWLLYGENAHPHTMCHMTHFTCLVSWLMCHLFEVEVVSGGFVIIGT